MTFSGILVTEKDSESFDSQISYVTQLLTNQRKIYEDEERALRVLREEETEEFNRVENEKRKKQKKSRKLMIVCINNDKLFVIFVKLRKFHIYIVL